MCLGYRAADLEPRSNIGLHMAERCAGVPVGVGRAISEVEIDEKAREIEHPARRGHRRRPARVLPS